MEVTGQASRSGGRATGTQ